MAQTITLVLWLNSDATLVLVQEDCPDTNDLEAFLNTIRRTGLNNFSIVFKEIDPHDREKARPDHELKFLQTALLAKFPIFNSQTKEAEVLEFRVAIRKMRKMKGCSVVPISQAQNCLIDATKQQDRRIDPLIWAALGQLGLELHGGWKALPQEAPATIAPHFGGPDRPLVL